MENKAMPIIGGCMCGAAIGSIVCFLLRKRTWDGPSHLVAL